MTVVIAGRSAERLAGTAEAIRELGATAAVTSVDVSDRLQVMALADEV